MFFLLCKKKSPENHIASLRKQTEGVVKKKCGVDASGREIPKKVRTGWDCNMKLNCPEGNGPEEPSCAPCPSPAGSAPATKLGQKSQRKVVPMRENKSDL